MNTKKVRLYYLTLALALAAITIVYLLVPVYPAYTLPAIPDLFGLAVVSTLLAAAWKIGKPLTVPFIVRRSEVIILGLIWFNLLILIAPRAFLSLFQTPGQQWIPCKFIPGFAPKLECLLQASSSQHYGIRNFFIFFVGVTLATLVFFLARTVQNTWKFLLVSTVFGATIVTGTGLLGAVFKIDQFLPKSLVNNPYGPDKMTQIFDNPGPVWTYLAPSLAITFWWSLAATDWYRRIFAIALSCFLTLGILATGQRGGFVLCLLYLIICSIYCSIKGWRKRNIPTLAVGGVVLTVLGSGVYRLVRNPLLVSEVASNIGHSWKAAPIFFPNGRNRLWSAAWNMFKESPIWGHGYASWFQILSEYVKTHPDVVLLHAAHNWFVQLFPEFGIVYTFCILLLTFLIIVIIAQNCLALKNGTLLFSLVVSSFLMISSLIEIDYVRPVFYSHIIFWSALAGLSPNIKSNSASLKKALTKYELSSLFKNQNYYVKRLDLISLGLIVSSLSCLGILYCLTQFTWGGSAFEAHLAQPSQIVFRWLGQSANVAAFKTGENQNYSLSELQPFEKPIAVRFKTFQIEANPDESISLALENGSRWWPKRHPVSFSKGMPDTARWISAGINYPFLQSNLAISWSKNLYWWEDFGGRLGRWCGKDCWFLAKSCGHKERLDFSLFAPRKDLTAATPLSLDIATYRMPAGGTFSSQTLTNLPQPLAREQFQLQNSEERLTVGVEGKEDTAWYLVRVGANSTLNPKTSGLSEDSRDLGVVVGEADCSKG